MKIRKYVIIVVVLALFNSVMLKFLNSDTYFVQYELLNINDEKVRNLCIDVEVHKVKEEADKIGTDVGEYLTVLMAVNDYSVDESALSSIDDKIYKRIRNHMVYYNVEKFNELKKLYGGLVNDLACFPVPKSISKSQWVSFVDSWGYERSYGGERRHEGTDIMADLNEAGVYPIVSMCDGVVESIGWLELGGYRIGIRSESGLYYYYAHMDSYAEGITEGSVVKAGQFLGFMGNTGYSKVEGTSGKFDVHLHMGIYYDCNKVETAYNSYYLLKNLGENVLYYDY